MKIRRNTRQIKLFLLYRRHCHFRELIKLRRRSTSASNKQSRTQSRIRCPRQLLRLINFSLTRAARHRISLNPQTAHARSQMLHDYNTHLCRPPRSSRPLSHCSQRRRIFLVKTTFSPYMTSLKQDRCQFTTCPSRLRNHARTCSKKSPLQHADTSPDTRPTYRSEDTSPFRLAKRATTRRNLNKRKANNSLPKQQASQLTHSPSNAPNAASDATTVPATVKP